jgi:uncharacterized protein
MAPATVSAAAGRIAAHARHHSLAQVAVVLHGGEPLLLGEPGLRGILQTLRAQLADAASVRLSMQTNGVLLTPEICDLLAEFGVRVGISLDGDRAANDRHRRFAHGAGSYDQVLAALELLRRPRYREIYGGILCTIDVRNDPVAVYEALAAQEPPRIDFLLPHATWDNPPLRPDGDPTPYATWLGRIRQRWQRDGMSVRVRIFDSLNELAVGGSSASESLGLDPADLAVVETDGSWEQADSLKTAFDGAPATGLDVFTHSVDEVARLPQIQARLGGLSTVSSVCQQCEVVRVCGGGLYAHRYRTGSGFDNPSAYCADLLQLIVSTPQPQRNTVPYGIVADLGAGAGTADTIGYLVAKQFSDTQAMLAAVGRRVLTEDGPARTHWLALEALDLQAPEVSRVVLSHPFLRPWLMRVLRTNDVSDAATRLAGLAMAIAIRARLPLALAMTQPDQVFALPTLGRVLLPQGCRDFAEFSTTEGELSLRGKGFGAFQVRLAEPTLLWEPAHEVGEDGLRLSIEDTDPERDCYSAPATARLDENAIADWQRLVRAAIDVINREVPEQMPGVLGALRAVVPLLPDPGGTERSATARDAFAALGVALPADAPALAVLIVHELQHVKLGALLDHGDLIDPKCREMLRVAWRQDLRPVEGALQGTYAHLAVASIWRQRATRAGDAVKRYEQYRDWTVDGIRALQNSGGLTPAGLEFVRQMNATVSSWEQV